MARNELRAVTDAVERAVAEQRRPPDENEGIREFLPVVAYLDQDPRGSRSAWRLVSAIRKRRPDLYNRFVGERGLRDRAVGIIAELSVDRGESLDFDRLVTELEKGADEGSRWLVAVPLANAITTVPYNGLVRTGFAPSGGFRSLTACPGPSSR